MRDAIIKIALLRETQLDVDHVSLVGIVTGAGKDMCCHLGFPFFLKYSCKVIHLFTHCFS